MLIYTVTHDLTVFEIFSQQVLIQNINPVFLFVYITFILFHFILKQAKD